MFNFKNNTNVDKPDITMIIIMILIFISACWIIVFQKVSRNIIVDNQGVEIYGNYSCFKNNLYIGEKTYYDSVIVLVPNAYCTNTKSKPRTISGKY